MSQTKELSLAIGGMSCGHCVGAVKRALQELPGVSIGELQIGKARVSYDPTVVDSNRIVDAVEDAGYQVVGQS